MNSPMNRRAALIAGAAAILGGCTARTEAPGPSSSATSPPASHARSQEDTPQQLDLSDLPDGTYGVWGTLYGQTVTHKPNTRLRMCSTMKLVLVATTLQQAARGRINLASTISWETSDLIGHSPVTRNDSGHRATIAELCEATASTSDNTAANLLIDAVGGLTTLTRFVRSLSDEITRFDRYETEMNIHDGALDTTTAESFGRLALSISETLSNEDRHALFSWLPARDDKRIAAVAPAGVDLVHKTGSSGDGAFNDVAIFIANDRAIGCLSVFTDSPAASEDTVVEIAQRSFDVLSA